MKTAHQYRGSMEAVKGKFVGLVTGTQQEEGAALPGQTELKPQRFFLVNGKVKGRLFYHFELLDGSLSAGEVRLKLLLGFLCVSQLLPQNLFLFSHGRDLQDKKV